MPPVIDLDEESAMLMHLEGAFLLASNVCRGATEVAEALHCQWSASVLREFSRKSKPYRWLTSERSGAAIDVAEDIRTERGRGTRKLAASAAFFAAGAVAAGKLLASKGRS